MTIAVKIRAIALVMFFIGTFTTTTTIAADESNGWYGEINYTRMDIDDIATLGTVGLTVGRDFTNNIAAEFQYGTSFGSDIVSGVKLSIDEYYGLFLKPNFQLNDKINAFVKLGYLDIAVKAGSAGAEGNEFAYGAGLEFDLSDKSYATIAYAGLEDTNSLQLSIGIQF